MIRYLDPIPESAGDASGYDLAVQSATPRLALLANSFPGSVDFLGQVERVLAERMPRATFLRYDKASMGINASIRVPDEKLDEIVAEADALVTAYGH